MSSDLDTYNSMKFVYIVDFPISGSSGKNKATREKAAALRDIVGENNFRFFHLEDNLLGANKIIARFLFDFRVFFSLLFEKNQATVIQRVFFMPLSRLLFSIKGWKVFSEFHADFKEEIPLLNKTSIQQKILKLISPIYDWNYKMSDGIIFNHPYLKEKFDSVFKKPSIYSYNGANVNDFVPEEKNQAREKLNIPEERSLFLFLGSVSQWHGVDYLIDTFNQNIIIERKDIYLYIVGAKDNSFVNQLKKSSLNTNIIFLPPVDNKTANDFINAADFCLLPVKNVRTSPGSPLKLYDYISCGKPIIAQSDIAGYSDEVLQYKLGYTVDFTNAPKAAEEILKIEKETDHRLFAYNRIIAQKELSWKRRMEKWLDFIIT